MSLVNNFDDLKFRLKDKWLDYYEANQSWITSTGIHPNNRVHPYYGFVLGVASLLEPEAGDFINLFARTSPNVESIAMVLGLYFNPRDELQARAARVAKVVEIEEIQEAKLLTASGEDYTDPLLEELRREARQMNSNSE